MIRILLLVWLALPAMAWGQLQKIQPCTLVETEWADGDRALPFLTVSSP